MKSIVRSFSLKNRNRFSPESNTRGEESVQPPERVVDSFPLSFAQQRLWFFDQLVPNNSVFNVPIAIRLVGKLDTGVLEQSLNEIIRHHEILRTSFTVEEAQPAQTVSRVLHIVLAQVDLRAVPELEREAKVLHLVAKEVQETFDLARERLLLRASLVQLGEEEYVLLLIVHNIIWDSWSSRVFIRELVTLYQSFASEQASLLPDLPVQYPSFAIRQRQWLQTEEAQAQLAYWKRQLSGAPPVLQLPIDRPRPTVQSFHAGYHTFQLSRTVVEALKALSQKEGVPLFTTLLTAINVLLFRYTGQDDVIVGIPAANRMQAEKEGLIGPYANMLVLRNTLSGDLRFAEVLGHVHKVASEASVHQDFPFERLVEVLQPEGDMSYHPLFQVMATMQHTPAAILEPSGLTWSPLHLENKVTPFDVAFEFSEMPEGLSTHLAYSTDLFDATTIARLAGHFETLLEGIVANPDQSIDELPILNEAERRQLLVEWNDTYRDYLANASVHQLFEAQSQRTPDAIAVKDEKCELTYRELNQRANQLAHYLRTLGVGPEILVGISLDRSVQMLIGLLAILKAGGAYVPLDPDFPIERLAYMIEDAQLKVLLTQDHLRVYLPIPEHIQTVSIDSDWQQFAQQSCENPEVPVDPEHLAYILYTSGSTGKPKGVQISQRALVNFLCSMLQEPGMSAGDTVLAVTTLSFDIAGLELYLPLLAGACVAIATHDTATDGYAIARALERVGATMLQATPVTWRLLLNSGWQGKANLVALCGGEALPPDLAEQLLPRVHALYNMYGPTETTIWSTFCRIQSLETPISIGRPLANTQVYVLDARMQPVPVGIPGELYIGGDGVARGYLHRHELTLERFLPDPFSTMPTTFPQRIYRTGDLVRYFFDGSLEHLGRLDHQVKIRGFRIELGEIEAALSQHPSVRECVVVAREDAQSNKRLVAYVVAEIGFVPTLSDLRRFLKEQLPDYMLPAAFVLLEAFPLTPNGKIDRKALPLPDTTDVVRDGAIATPGTPTEKRLAGMVAPLLGLDQVGIDDNFFLIGGNSLMGVQLIAQLADVFGIDFPLRTLFNTPTVRQLATEIERLIFARVQAMSDDEARSLLEQG